MAFKIFVSYSRKDEVSVQKLMSRLRDLSHTGLILPWIDRDIPLGEDWAAEINAQIDGADIILLMISPVFLASKHCTYEMDRALSRSADGKALVIPIILRTSELPQAIGRLQALPKDARPVSEWKREGDAFNQIVASIRQQVESRLVNDIDVVKKENCTLFDKWQGVAAELNELKERLQTAMAFNGLVWDRPVADGCFPFRDRTDGRPPIVAVANLKGGVGKSTIAGNLGATLWTQGYKVLVVDLDYQASLTAMCIGPALHSHLGNAQRTIRELFEASAAAPEAIQRFEEPIDPDHRGFLIAADEMLLEAEHRLLVGWLTGDIEDDVRFRLRCLLHSSGPAYRHHVILLDCPPRFTPATINALACSDMVMIPTPLDALNRERVILFAKWLTRLKKEGIVANSCELSIVANFVEPAEKQLVEPVLESLTADAKLVGDQSLKPFAAHIPRRVAIRAAAGRRQLAALVDRDVGEAFATLAAEVRLRLGLHPLAPQTEQ